MKSAITLKLAVATRKVLAGIVLEHRNCLMDRKSKVFRGGVIAIIRQDVYIPVAIMFGNNPSGDEGK